MIVAKDRRFILIRHGQTEKYKEKTLQEQTDAPLSRTGIIQATKAGFVIDKMKPFTFSIYSSDLKSDFRTAEFIRALIPILKNLKPEPGLREMNMGSCDEKNISESIYDLQYRVCRTLTKILEEDNSYDIIIIAHSGVLRCIENNLRGGDVADAWDEMDNGEVRVIEL